MNFNPINKLGLKTCFFLLICFLALIWSNPIVGSSGTWNISVNDEESAQNNSRDYTVIILILAFVAIIPEVYLGKKFSNFVNRQKLNKGLGNP